MITGEAQQNTFQ